MTSNGTRDNNTDTEKLSENRNFSNYYFWSAEKVVPTVDFEKSCFLTSLGENRVSGPGGVRRGDRKSVV